MLPVAMVDGPPVFLLGMRETPSEPFRYLRIPVDAEGSMDDFMRLRYALLDPIKREKAVKRYAVKAVDPKNAQLVQQLGASAARALSLFAGPGPSTTANSVNSGKAGLEAVSDFIEANVPEAERNRAGEVLIRILNGALFELAQISREDARLPALPIDEKTRTFMTQAVLALSDVPLYPAPVLLQLSDFTQVQASVFQVARAPGKTVVYLGCALLILGVFAMLYIRERRLWIWFSLDAGVGPDGSANTLATMALSANRKTMDGDREFDQLKTRLLGQTSET
jgi:cytochrome c biogenesis protein